MAEVFEKLSSASSFTLTSANLASSATAGWMSAVVDNSSTLYLDALVSIELAAVNTAPASNKAVYLFSYALVDTAGSAYTSTGDGTPTGSVGTITFPDITSLPIVAPLLRVVPYPVQNKAINGGPFSVARCFDGVLPIKWGIMMLNYSGMTLNVTAIKWQGVTNTVA